MNATRDDTTSHTRWKGESLKNHELQRDRGWHDIGVDGVVGGHWQVGVFFFSSRRRHTRLQGDWSSDVCSSDLFFWFCFAGALGTGARDEVARARSQGAGKADPKEAGHGHLDGCGAAFLIHALSAEIGRASCRERV